MKRKARGVAGDLFRRCSGVGGHGERRRPRRRQGLRRPRGAGRAAGRLRRGQRDRRDARARAARRGSTACEAAAGLDVSQRFSLIDAVAGRVTKGRLRALARHPLVDHVERNSPSARSTTRRRSRSASPPRAPTRRASTATPTATSTPTPPADLVAAVIDTGIDAGHGDLNEGKVIAFRDFVNNITTPYDDHGHGTHVAATLAGRGRRARRPPLPRRRARRGAGRASRSSTRPGTATRQT